MITVLGNLSRAWRQCEVKFRLSDLSTQFGPKSILDRDLSSLQCRFGDESESFSITIASEVYTDPPLIDINLGSLSEHWQRPTCKKSHRVMMRYFLLASILLNM